MSEFSECKQLSVSGRLTVFRVRSWFFSFRKSFLSGNRELRGRLAYTVSKEIQSP